MKKILNSFWIDVFLALVLLGGFILVLVEPKQLKAALNQASQTINKVTSSIVDLISGRAKVVSTSDLLGLVVIIVVIGLVYARLRYHIRHSSRWNIDVCPKCQRGVVRVHRSWVDRLFARLFLPHAHRYRCKECGWTKLGIELSSSRKEHHDSSSRSEPANPV